MMFVLVVFCFWVAFLGFKKKYFTNKYIDSHKEMKKENKDYQDYLKYCDSNNEIPIHKNEFINVLDKKESKV